VRAVVVGSGIVGASAAWHLARDGVHVVVVDRGEPGQATAAGAGIVCPWLSAVEDPRWYELARAAALAYPGLLDEVGGDTGWGRVGGLVVSADPATVERAAGLALARRAVTPEVGEVATLGPGEAVRVFPPLAHDLAAVHVQGGWRVDGRRVRDALLAAAARAGAERRSGDAALGVERGRAVVTVDGRAVEGDAVVVAAGAWAASALRPLGVEVAVEPQRGQLVHLDVPGTDTSAWPSVVADAGHYLVAFPPSRVVAGATRETGSGFDLRATAGGLADVLARALATAPGLAGATWVEARVGFRPLAADGLPLLGPVPGLDGLVVATGLGAGGLTAGPYVGRLAADLATGRPPAFDVSPYAVTRTAPARPAEGAG
jgi:D-amino-acid dehydrogenase